MRYLIIISALLFAPTAQPGQLGLSLGSFHITDKKGDGGIAHNDRNRPYNEFNPGLTYYTDGNLMFGVFINSYSGTSVFGGKRFVHPMNKNVGLDIGVVSYGNYKFTGKAVTIPMIQVTYNIDNFRIGYSPTIGERSYGVFTLQYIIPVN